MPFTSDIRLIGSEEEANFRFKLTFPDLRSVSNLARSLISRLLVVNPEHRMTIDEAIVHPWIIGS